MQRQITADDESYMIFVEWKNCPVDKWRDILRLTDGIENFINGKGSPVEPEVKPANGNLIDELNKVIDILGKANPTEPSQKKIVEYALTGREYLMQLKKKILTDE